MRLRLLCFYILAFCLPSCGDFFVNEVEFNEDELQNQISIVARLVNINPEVDKGDLFRAFNIGVLITKTASVIGEANFEVIENASVEIINEQGARSIYEFNENIDHYFPSDFSFITSESNRKYSLEIDIPGSDLIKSEVVMPTPAIFEVLKFEKDNINIDNNILDKLEFQLSGFEEPSFFLLKAHYELKQIIEKDTIQSIFEAEVFSFDSSFSDEAEMFSVDPSESGQTFVFWSDQPSYPTLKILRVIYSLWTLSEEEYKFATSLNNNRNAGDNPFVEPSILFDNIENGVGVFSLSNLQTVEFEFE